MIKLRSAVQGVYTADSANNEPFASPMIWPQFSKQNLRLGDPQDGCVWYGAGIQGLHTLATYPFPHAGDLAGYDATWAYRV
jgi:hypothetical protein